MGRRRATTSAAATEPESKGSKSGVKERGRDEEISTNIASTHGVVGGEVSML